MAQIPPQLRNRTIQEAAFLMEIDQVCKKHGISIAHEDGQGRFTLMNYQKTLRDWLMNARADFKLKIQPQPSKKENTHEQV